MGSTNSAQIQDGGTSQRKAAVVPVVSDPTKNALVVTNADGSPVGGGLLTLLLDDYTTANITYIGFSTPGTATSAASWQIFKLDETTGLSKKYAAAGAFSQIRDNRTSLSYA